MTFASIPFLFYFLPLFIAAYYATPAKNAVLLAGSLVFYAWGEPVLVLLLVGSTVVNHLIGAALARSPSRALLALGVTANLAALGVFKYLGFLTENLGLAVSALGGPVEAVVLDIRLPLGISFYTFQAISFLIDVYRRDAPAPRRWLDTALFIAMFPQLIAGPIVRFKTIEGQIRKRRHTAARFADGARLFILGLAQKVLLANVFAGSADAAYNDDPSLLVARAAWGGAICFALQIYFDFAGYSNMAMGLGRMFGLRLPRNFDFPYVSRSVTEFWRRWHITLSAWFRDYLYIPLGGNRRGTARTYMNLVVVFVLCGLWHGAAWAFVAWGGYHGAFLVLERSPAGGVLRAAPAVVQRAYLLLVVTLGWVPFRTENLGSALGYYRAMFDFTREAPIHWKHVVSNDVQYVVALGIAIALFPLVRAAGARVTRLARRLVRADAAVGADAAAGGRGLAQALGVGVLAARSLAAWAALGALLIMSAALLAGGVYNPFIYFRF